MRLTIWIPFFLLNIIVLANGTSVSSSGGNLYRGKYIGPLTARQHKVSGEVYAVDARTLHIRGFTYSGTGPDAFFWTGFTEHPSPQGVIVPNEKGTKEVLGGYNNQDITITLPDGLSLRDIKWFGVWCRAYEVNFGDLYIPQDLDYPQPHVIGSLTQKSHGVTSGPIVVVDAQTILVPDFSYDGQAPDVHFWVGKGSKPGADGIRVPDETGGDAPLAKSDKKTMVLTLPGDLTVFDIDFFGVWCRLYYVDFGHVKIPPNLNVPPSLKMLGVTPQPTHLQPIAQIYGERQNELIHSQPPLLQYIQQPQFQTSQINPLENEQILVQPHHQGQILINPQPQEQILVDPQSQGQILVNSQSQGQIIENPPTQIIVEPQNQAQVLVSPQSNGQILVDPQNQGQVLVYPQQVQEENLVKQVGLNSPQENIVFQKVGESNIFSAPSHYGQVPLGSNGYSSITIRTSKGSSQSLSLYK